MIKQYGAVEEVFENLGELTPRLRANLTENRQQVLLNKELMTLRRDVELEVEMSDLVRRAWDVERVRELVTSLEFFSLWSDLQAVQVGGAEPEISRPEVETRVLTSAQAVADLGDLDHLYLEMVRDEHFLGLAVREEENRVVLVPEDLLDAMADLLSDPKLPKTTHDAKPLIRWLRSRGLDLEGLAFDTALAAYVVNPATGRYQLDELAERMVGFSLTEDLGKKIVPPRPAWSLTPDPGSNRSGCEWRPLPGWWIR